MVPAYESGRRVQILTTIWSQSLAHPTGSDLFFPTSLETIIYLPSLFLGFIWDPQRVLPLIPSDL